MMRGKVCYCSLSVEEDGGTGQKGWSEGMGREEDRKQMLMNGIQGKVNSSQHRY